MFLTDKEIKTKTSQLKGELKACIRQIKYLRITTDINNLSE